jgi:hypothetical protein
MTWALSISTSFGSLPTSPPTSASASFWPAPTGRAATRYSATTGISTCTNSLPVPPRTGHHHLGRAPAARAIHRHVEAVAASGKALGIYFPDDRHRISRQVPDLHAQKFLYRLPDGG